MRLEGREEDRVGGDVSIEVGPRLPDQLRGFQGQLGPEGPATHADVEVGLLEPDLEAAEVELRVEPAVVAVPVVSRTRRGQKLTSMALVGQATMQMLQTTHLASSKRTLMLGRSMCRAPVGQMAVQAPHIVQR